MEKKSPRYIVLISVFFILLMAVSWHITKHVYSIHGNRIEKVTMKNNIFYAEVVSTDEKMQKGLGGRKDMCEYCAMLFVFKEPGRYGFWMKGMNFPIDIIWIRKGRVVHIEKNISEKSSRTFVSENAADAAMEINTGLSDKLDLKIGDMIGLGSLD